MSQDVPNTIFCILHVLCADLCMSDVQIYACVMCIAVQTGSLRFAGLALLALRPYSACIASHRIASYRILCRRVRYILYIYIYSTAPRIPPGRIDGLSCVGPREVFGHLGSAFPPSEPAGRATSLAMETWGPLWGPRRVRGGRL